MNSSFHKAQAEGLIREANRLHVDKPWCWENNYDRVVSLAQVHATLATVEDETDYGQREKLGPI